MSHGQIYHGFAAFGERLVVFAQTAVAAEPGERAFDDPSPGQDHEARQVVAALDDLQDPATELPRPLDQLPGVAASAQIRFRRGKSPLSLASTRLAPSRSWMLAACTTTASTRPSVSTTM